MGPGHHRELNHLQVQLHRVYTASAPTMALGWDEVPSFNLALNAWADLTFSPTVSSRQRPVVGNEVPGAACLGGHSGRREAEKACILAGGGKP
eukprot:g31898.t1